MEEGEGGEQVRVCNVEDVGEVEEVVVGPELETGSVGVVNVDNRWD